VLIESEVKKSKVKVTTRVEVADTMKVRSSEFESSHRNNSIADRLK